jgi:hypothetical protein
MKLGGTSFRNQSVVSKIRQEEVSGDRILERGTMSLAMIMPW